MNPIGITLQHRDEIAAFEARHLRAQPWPKLEHAAL